MWLPSAREKWYVSCLHGSFNTQCTISHTPSASAKMTRTSPDGGRSNSLGLGVILECYDGHSAGMRNKLTVLRCWALGFVCYCCMALLMLTSTHISWTRVARYASQNIRPPVNSRVKKICISFFMKPKVFTFYNSCIFETALLMYIYYIE